MKKHFAAAIVTTFVFIAVVRGLPAGSQEQQIDVVDQALTGVDSGDSHAVRKLIDMRNTIVKHLIATVRMNITAKSGETERSPEQEMVSEAAIRVLGEFRATEAVECLVAHIELGPPDYQARVLAGKLIGPESKKYPYPCVDALIRIGQPAVQPILERAEGSDDWRTLMCSGRALVGILGEARTVEILQAAIEHCTDGNESLRLRTCLQYVRDYCGEPDLTRKVTEWKAPGGTAVPPEKSIR